MKKKWLLLGLLLMVLCATGCGKKITTYEEISYNEFKEKIKDKDSFALFVGSTECSHCDNYKVTLNEFVSDYQVKVYYIDIIKMEQDELKEFMSVVNFKSTPTTVFITDGEEKTVYNRIVGALPYSKIEAKFEKAGYIKVK